MGNAATDRPRVGPSVNRGTKRPAKIDPAKTRCPICGRQRLLQATKLETGEVVRRWRCKCGWVDQEDAADPPLTARELARRTQAQARVQARRTEGAERVRQHEEHLAQRAERQAQRADAPGR